MNNGHYTIEELQNDRNLWTRAKDEALRALNHDQRDVGALLLMGRLMDAIDQRKCGLAYYARAVAADPKSLAALGACATSYLISSDTRHAEVLFRKALEASPGDPHMLNGLGATLTKQKKSVEAKQCFHAAIDRNPHQPQSYYYLAELHLAEANPQEAAAAVQVGMFQAFRMPDADMIENLRKLDERIQAHQSPRPQPGY